VKDMLSSERTEQLWNRITERITRQVEFLARERVDVCVNFFIWRRLVPSNRLLIRRQAEKDYDG